MAIIQISKIQVRTGNLADLPQLSTGEFGLATDANRLYIGTDANVLGPTPQNLEILTSASGLTVGGPNTAIQFNDSGNQDGSGNFTFDRVTNQLTLAGNFIPGSTEVFDLGSNVNRWRDLYLSGNSIQLGNVGITANAANYMVVANVAVNEYLIANLGLTVGGNVSVGGNLTANNAALTGNITANNLALTGNFTAGNIVANSVSMPGNAEVDNLTANGAVRADAVYGNLYSPTLGNSVIVMEPTEVSIGANSLVDLFNIGTVGNRANILAAGDMYVTGNLQVAGTTIFANVSGINVVDPLIDLGTGPNGGPLPAPDAFDRGVLNHTYGNGVADELHFMGWKSADNKFLFANVTESNSVVSVVNLANVQGNYWLGNTLGNSVDANTVYATFNTPGAAPAIYANRTVAAGTNQGAAVYANATGDSDTYSVFGQRNLGNGASYVGGLGWNQGGNISVRAAVLGYASPANPDIYAGYFSGPVYGASVQTTTLTTGAVGTAGSITGNWALTAGSRLESTYADLAEYYVPDADYVPGTVLSLGGAEEVTVANRENCDAVAGVVTTEPAYVMNSGISDCGVAIGLVGRVPTLVLGNIGKGEMLYVSTTPGVATSRSELLKQDPTVMNPGSTVGRAIQSYNSPLPGLIDVLITR